MFLLAFCGFQRCSEFARIHLPIILLTIPVYLTSPSTFPTDSYSHSKGVRQINWEFLSLSKFSFMTPISAHRSHWPNASALGMLSRHHPNTHSSSRKQEKCPLDSGSRSIYTKSSAFQAYLQNTIWAIPSESVQQPQQPHSASQTKLSRSSAAGHLRHIIAIYKQQSYWSPTSTYSTQLNLNLTLLGACKQLACKHTWDGPLHRVSLYVVFNTSTSLTDNTFLPPSLPSNAAILNI